VLRHSLIFSPIHLPHAPLGCFKFGVLFAAVALVIFGGELLELGALLLIERLPVIGNQLGHLA